jgi:uncharacterized protein YbcC (UPF0753/DUF2309 family)
MSGKYLTSIWFLFCILMVSAFAGEEDLRSTFDYKINKLKTEFNLTESQAVAIRPVIKEYMTARQAVLRDAANQGIVDRTDVKASLKQLKEEEHSKLTQILTEEQMRKWIDKEHLMASLNPDSVESSPEDEGGGGLSAAGASINF